MQYPGCKPTDSCGRAVKRLWPAVVIGIPANSRGTNAKGAVSDSTPFQGEHAETFTIHGIKTMSKPDDGRSLRRVLPLVPRPKRLQEPMPMEHKVILSPSRTTTRVPYPPIPSP